MGDIDYLYICDIVEANQKNRKSYEPEHFRNEASGRNFEET
jgi:hypothetical protein